MDALVLTQWEYQEQDGASQGSTASDDATAEAIVKSDAHTGNHSKRQDLSGIFFTSEGYDPRVAKGYESSGEQSRRGAWSKANRISPLSSSTIQVGEHNIICFILDSQLVTLKLQLILVGDECGKPLRIKLCGPRFAKKARGGGAWGLGNILYIRELKVCVGRDGVLEGVLKDWEWDGGEQVVVLKQLSAEMSTLGGVDFTRLQQLCIPGDFYEDVVLPKCERIFEWVKKEKMALLRFAAMKTPPKALHYRSLASLTHADVVTLVGKPTLPSLSFFPTKAGMRERPYCTLEMANGDSVVVVLSTKWWPAQRMKSICEQVERMLKGGGLVFCIGFKTGWCFPQDKVKLVPTRESEVLSLDDVRRHQPHLLQHFTLPLQEQVGLGARKRKKVEIRTDVFGSVKALIDGKNDPGEFLAQVPAFIAATKGIPKAQLRCRSCGGSCIVDKDMYTCKRKCVWGGGTPSGGIESEVENTVSSIVLSPGVPDLDCDFVANVSPTKAGAGKPPVGFVWKVSPFYAILSDISALPAGEKDTNTLPVQISEVGLKELIAVDPYQLHLAEVAVAYRKILTDKGNAKFKYLLKVHKKESSMGRGERKVTLTAVDFLT